MNASIKTFLTVIALFGLYSPAAVYAQRSSGGVVGDARLHPGTWSSQGTSRSVARSQPTYRSAAPEIVSSEAAPTAVAQKSTDQRSFSYEPKEEATASKEVTKAKSGGCGNGSTVRTEPTPTTAPRSTESGRSYSYEPSTASSDSTVRTVQPMQRSYSSPRSRGGSGSGFSIDKAMRAKGY
jgi:hypothetical protein